jgi:FHA domain
MARLVLQPGSPVAREIQLKAGINSLGRGPANDVALDDPSVSGSHCHIVVGDGHAKIIDLGSTNGTYVNRTRVLEAALQPGQTIHLGGLEMTFHADASASAGAAHAAPAAPPPPPPRAVGPPRAARAAPPAPIALAAPPVAAGPGRQAPIAAPPVAAAPTAAVGSGPCRYHPKTPGRFFCSHCQLFFCEICVTTRGQQKFCRTCGTECAPVQVQIQRPAGPKGFFARLPGAFVYPFRGSGLLVLLVSTFVLALMDFLGSWGFIFFFFLKIIAYGYLFSFMQNLIHATANEEEQMPDLPGFDEVLGGALRLAVTVLVSFGVPILLSALKVYSALPDSNMGIPTSVILATMVLGCLYFPMAFLAVAMKDTAFAANPLVVIPAIFKVPLGYLVTTMLVIGIFVLRQFGGAAAGLAAGTSHHTHDMSRMFMAFGLRAAWSLVSIYLLTVSMRILGLLYVTNKQKFGWFGH